MSHQSTCIWHSLIENYTPFLTLTERFPPRPTQRQCHRLGWDFAIWHSCSGGLSPQHSATKNRDLIPSVLLPHIQVALFYRSLVQWKEHQGLACGNEREKDLRYNEEIPFSLTGKEANSRMWCLWEDEFPITGGMQVSAGSPLVRYSRRDDGFAGDVNHKASIWHLGCFLVSMKWLKASSFQT